MPQEVHLLHGCSVGRQCRSDICDRGEQFAYLMRRKLPLNFILDLVQSAAPPLDILASVSHQQPARFEIIRSMLISIEAVNLVGHGCAWSARSMRRT
jgi:hypothetical protein